MYPRRDPTLMDVNLALYSAALLFGFFTIIKHTVSIHTEMDCKVRMRAWRSSRHLLTGLLVQI